LRNTSASSIALAALKLLLVYAHTPVAAKLLALALLRNTMSSPAHAPAAPDIITSGASVIGGE